MVAKLVRCKYGEGFCAILVRNNNDVAVKACPVDHGR
jgi:hypothetical protein